MTRIEYTKTGNYITDITPLSEIVPGVDQGMRPKTYRGYDLVVSCEEFLAKGPMESFDGMVIHLPMRDDDEFKIPEAKIGAAVAAMEQIHSDRGKILVHCTGGLNRSSLVTAQFLKTALEMSPREAVVYLRAVRDKYVLCNRAFERWVLEEFLPTAETTTFQEESE